MTERNESLLAMGLKDIGKAIKSIKPKTFLKLFEEKPKDEEKLRKELEEIERYVVTGKGKELPEFLKRNEYDVWDDIYTNPAFSDLSCNIYHHDYDIHYNPAFSDYPCNIHHK